MLHLFIYLFRMILILCCYFWMVFNFSKVLSFLLIIYDQGEALFQTHENLEHLAMMERVLGPLPQHMVVKAE